MYAKYNCLFHKMKYIIHKPNPEKKFKVAILIKELSFNKIEIEKYYVQPMVDAGILKNDIISISLQYKDDNTCPVSYAKKYLDNLLKQITKLGNPILLVADPTYFKVLTKERTIDPNFGYIKSCKLEGWDKINCTVSYNFSGLIYNPANKAKLDMSVRTINDYITGFHQAPGTNILDDITYPESVIEIATALSNLRKCPVLTVDIETGGLKLTDSLLSIGFAWNMHSGVSFCITSLFESNTLQVLNLLTRFFTHYTGKLVYHGGTFDIKFLIYNLFMHNPTDYAGMVNGLDIMTKNIGDTMVMTYLATNTTSENRLDLKSNAHEFAGNYAQSNIKDMGSLSKKELLEYNLIDCLSTWYLCTKYFPVVAEEQLEIYNNIFIPSIKVVVQMELVGMPLDFNKVNMLQKLLKDELNSHSVQILTNSLEVSEFTKVLRLEALVTKNATLKRIQKTIDDFKHIEFNPNSNTQVGRLLHERFKLPVIDTTPKGQPQVGTGVLKKLKQYANNKEQDDVLDNLINIGEASIILNTFIKSFLANSIRKRGHSYLHGGFNICGPKSGRMSSSKPNLQNIPSTGTRFAKQIKECFVAPPGWIMVGVDFSSLEDRISALTTKDPNKLKVYMGHIVYELKIDGIIHNIRDDASIEYNGKTYTGEEFYEAYCSL